MKKTNPKLTLKETAKYLGVSRPRVYYMMKQGLLTEGWILQASSTSGPRRILGFNKTEVIKRKEALDFIKETENNQNNYITIESAAKMLGVTMQWISELCAKQELKCMHIAHRVLITRDSLIDYKAKRDASLADLSV